MPDYYGDLATLPPIPDNSWLPAEPQNPGVGAYGIARGEDGWIGYAALQASPPPDIFIPGWAFFGFDQIETLLGLGSVHAACSFGRELPIIAGVSFQRSSTNSADVNVPANGWAGSNWRVQPATAANPQPSIGNNNARLETTVFNDLPDPSFGAIAGVDLLCRSSFRRNTLVTISNLVVGRRYYYFPIFGTYPNPLTRATIIEPSDGGDRVVFGVDGVGAILERGIRRYGFEAQTNSISFLKSSPDTNGSYQSGFFVMDMGAAA